MGNPTIFCYEANGLLNVLLGRLMIESYFKKKAIKAYVQTLPLALSKRYGGSGPWNEAQIKATVIDSRLSSKYIQYALYLYSGEAAHTELGIDETKIGAIKKFITSLGFLPQGGAEDGGAWVYSTDTFFGDAGGADGGGD